ncbi:hypothetical protein BGZ65_011705 [Modicella reniformis]|uniref:Uncharacterized protein n=1 Tax=Modicella reniformis TaxID=1440133 RepID=A0A9P6JJU0_9FUNG|nr:hypothetical protein BGZ65_011705 [Modicella reniformis]
MSCPKDRFILYVWAESDSPKETAKEELTAAIRKLVHIPGDPLSLKAPSTGSPRLRFFECETPAAGEEQSRMSLDQELDMDRVREEILEAERRLFEESETNTPVLTPASPGDSGAKTGPRLFQRTKTPAGLSTVPTVAPQALFSLFYKRTTSWPRVPYPIGSENLTPLPGNMTVLKPMNHSLDFEAATEEARDVFERLCPGVEFLPPTPDPEDGVSGY